MSTICVFGDSTAWGAWDTEKGGWVNRLWLLFAEKKEDTEEEAKTRGAEVLIFQSGGNDAAYEHKEGNYQVPLDKFKENIEEIIQRAKKIADKIMFVSFKNVDEKRTKPVSWIDIYYTNENIGKYNGVMKEICDKHNIPFLSIFGLLADEDLEDGLHPNSAGHKKIFEKVKEFLIKNKIIKI